MRSSSKKLFIAGPEREEMEKKVLLTVGIIYIDDFYEWFEYFCIKDRSRFPLKLDSFLIEKVVERAKTFRDKMDKVNVTVYPPGYAQYKTGIRKCRNN
jgi:hypothetical protein